MRKVYKITSKVSDVPKSKRGLHCCMSYRPCCFISAWAIGHVASLLDELKLFGEMSYVVDMTHTDLIQAIWPVQDIVNVGCRRASPKVYTFNGGSLVSAVSFKVIHDLNSWQKTTFPGTIPTVQTCINFKSTFFLSVVVISHQTIFQNNFNSVSCYWCVILKHVVFSNFTP